MLQIGNLKDPSSISLLVQFLKDDAEELNLMWSIIHTIESFDNDIYVREILNKSSDIYKNSPDWAALIFIRIINLEESKNELIRQLSKISLIHKKSVKNIMIEMNKESPEFFEKTAPVILEATL